MAKATVLIVEDEGIIAWNIQTILSRFGYGVAGVAASGSEALQKVAETHPDLILMDIRLQGDMDGIETAEQIRVRFNIPVVYVTAHVSDHIIERAKATEPFGYIVKPFQEKELNATIELALYKFKIERNLHAEKEWFAQILKSMGDSVVVTDEKGAVTFMNPFAEALTGWEQADAIGKDVREVVSLVHTDAPDVQENPIAKAIERGVIVRLADQWILRTKQGSETPIGDCAAPICDEDGKITGVVAIFQDITERKRAETALRQLVERERLIGLIAQRIRQSLDLTEVLQTTVTQVQQFLHTDRVLIYRFEPDWSGIVTVEAVHSSYQPLLGRRLLDPCFASDYVEPYRQGRVQATDDIYTARLTPCHIELLEQLEVKANLVVPILQGERLWGLLVAHHCRASRQWQSVDVELLQQLATQLAIAIQQSELYQQIQRLNATLEQQVQERTAQLQQALEFEAVLKRITDDVRNSLDESQILQTVVQELTFVLGAQGCDTALYDLAQSTATICYEYLEQGVLPAQGTVIQMAEFPEGYRQLLQEQHFQFCETVPSLRGPITLLACPIFDNQGVLGDLWLFKQQHEAFSDLEVNLVEHVATQCAIAIRQARLHQEAQTQVVELAKLNQLKDDFLNTISHELRTPISNVHLAIQMLDVILEQEGVLNPQSDRVARYLQILRDGCKREITLINDLLALQQLKSGAEPFTRTTIRLQDWLPNVMAPFIAQAQSQQQTLQVDIEPTLPPLTTELPRLERIVVELLNNACKYTPTAGEIVVTVRAIAGDLQLEVNNSGIEIAASELPRIFDTFYRVPQADPWKHGGTGLGLALVKQVVEYLGGTIQADSYPDRTTIVVTLPY